MVRTLCCFLKALRRVSEEHTMSAMVSPFGGEMPDILLVEDNPLHIRLVKSMIADIWPEPNGLRIAKRLESAITELQEKRPDCVLLDLLLPDADGLEAVNAVLAVDHDVPVVVLSSHDDDELALQSVREGAQDYLVKGTIGPEGLARAVRFSIHRQRISRQGVSSVPTMPDLVSPGVAIVDAEGVMVALEPEVAGMLGVDADELSGASVADLTHPNDVAGWKSALQRAASGSAPESVIRIRHASGNDLRARVELTRLMGAESVSYLMRLYPLPPEGTASSGQYAVVTEWA